MKQETLERIGRAHSPKDIQRAFEIAQKIGFPVINADLIAGLPGEDVTDFLDSLKQVLELKPQNITVHTLAVKRASKLKELDEDYSYHQGKKVIEMLDQGANLLAQSGFRPYYLYRQKQMTGNLENVGYALPGTENLYNIKIMEENQTVIALGAGGISKVWYPKERLLKRVANVSNYEIYIERIEEMLQRKQDGIFSN
jgi:coproporphyrinogen III oxidase-like Fe-S oxidoreductase